jgi:hypothetical protein
MKMPEIFLAKRQQRFGTEEDCLAVLFKVRWADGFVFSMCGAKNIAA